MQLWYSKPADKYPGVNAVNMSWYKGKPKKKKKVVNPANVHAKDKAWEKYALPLGNSFIGAMIYGGVNRDHIQFNEHSIWSGGPGTENWRQEFCIKDAWKNLPEIRKALYDGDSKLAQQLSKKYLIPSGKNKSRSSFGQYQTFGDIVINTGLEDIVPEDYRRELDLEKGVINISFTLDGVKYKRDYFISYPDRCMVIRYSADKPGLQNSEMRIYSPHDMKGSVENGIFRFKGELRDNKLKIEADAGVITDGGEVKIDEQGIRVTGANSVTFIITAGTDYAMKPPAWRGEAPGTATQKQLNSAIKKGFDALQKRHIADHSGLFDRVDIELGRTPANIAALPTDERLMKNKTEPDHGLEALLFQYGRYLMIASSRPGSLPANLQGIWNKDIKPPWDSDYHLNINVEMNYWPSGPCNLLECEEPLVDYIEMLSKMGKVPAESYFNARGWTANLRGNIWGFTSPSNASGRPMFWGFYPMGGPWMTTHVFEHFAFSMDKEFLKNRAWPIIASSSDFVADYLTELPSGELSSAPSWSPEHGPISKGAYADVGIARESLINAMHSAEALNEKGERVDIWESRLNKILPYKIGKHGQLQEWYEDIDKPKDRHRHVNHLFGLHPGNHITPDLTPDLFKAAKVTLTQRGDGATGWSMGWKINFWARLHDGNHAYLLLRNLLKKGISRNLFDLHPPFQIDGNFGATAGIAEMLMQSRYSGKGCEITLLPALPDAWKNGSFKGLMARGAFEIDAEWKDGKITDLSVKSLKGGKASIRFSGEKHIFDAKPGEVFQKQ